MFVTSEISRERGGTVIMKDRLERARDMLMSMDPTASWEMALAFLKVADRHPQGITQVELTAELSPHRQNVTRWLDRLGEHKFTRVGKTKYPHLNLIRRTIAAYDLRVRVLTLTPLGVRKKAEIDRGDS